MKRTFVLGVGAQKAGTTWLHKYIRETGVASLGRLKEYHVWDAITIPNCHRFRVNGDVKGLKRLLGIFRSPAAGLDAADALRLSMQRSPDAYFDYFDKLVSGANTITADITPSYMGLSEDVLRTIRQGFESRGLDVKSILLLRDPVDRCWSHFRHMARLNIDEQLFEKITNPEVQFLKFIDTQEARIRTDYVNCAKRLKSVFADENIHIGFYETMFTPGEIDRLSDFLGVKARPELGGVRVHEGEKSDLPKQVFQEARTRLDEIYRDCAQFLPETQPIWRSA